MKRIITYKPRHDWFHDLVPGRTYVVIDIIERNGEYFYKLLNDGGHEICHTVLDFET